VKERTCVRETHTWRGRKRVCASERQSVEARSSAKGRKRERHTRCKRERHTRCKSEGDSARARKSASKREKLVSFDTRIWEIFMKIRLFYHTAAPERQQTNTHTYIPTYIQTYTHNAYTHTNIHACIKFQLLNGSRHTYIQTYVHTYIQTFKHIHIHATHMHTHDTHTRKNGCKVMSTNICPRT